MLFLSSMTTKWPTSLGLALLCASVPVTSALSLDATNSASIKSASQTIAYGLMKYYTGNVTSTELGILPQPYYWWEAGAVWGAMIDYYHLTGDATYNDNVYEALISQVGPNYDYMVPAQMQDEGNDDQAFWGFAVMAAAENNWPAPPTPIPSWAQLATNLWNSQVARWDTSNCGGGLRWQIYTSNNGYNYKNSVSNGAFFQLSARLARFTGNSTYSDWATKTFEWTQSVGFMDSNYNVYDGAQTPGCTDINKIQWTYAVGIYLYGASVMYDVTSSSSTWQTRVQGLMANTQNFFSPYSNTTNVMYEAACETIGTCNNDQWSFKAYLGRFMWKSTQMAPFITSSVNSMLQTSAAAAAQSCSGGSDGMTCGSKWYVGGWDGRYGVGQQLSALETIQGLLISGAAAPVVGSQASSPAPLTTVASAAPVPATTAAPQSSTVAAASVAPPASSTPIASVAPPVSTTSPAPAAPPTSTTPALPPATTSIAPVVIPPPASSSTVPLPTTSSMEIVPSTSSSSLLEPVTTSSTSSMEPSTSSSVPVPLPSSSTSSSTSTSTSSSVAPPLPSTSPTTSTSTTTSSFVPTSSSSITSITSSTTSTFTITTSSSLLTSNVQTTPTSATNIIAAAPTSAASSTAPSAPRSTSTPVAASSTTSPTSMNSVSSMNSAVMSSTSSMMSVISPSAEAATAAASTTAGVAASSSKAWAARATQSAGAVAVVAGAAILCAMNI